MNLLTIKLTFPLTFLWQVGNILGDNFENCLRYRRVPVSILGTLATTSHIVALIPHSHHQQSRAYHENFHPWRLTSNHEDIHLLKCVAPQESHRTFLSVPKTETI